MTGYAYTSPLVDGNGNGYPTPYVANVTNAFGGSPSITYKWLPRPGKTYANAAGDGVSINDNGAVVMGGEIRSQRKTRSTTVGLQVPAVPGSSPCRSPRQQRHRHDLDTGH